jgi:hypothetical protein
LFVALLSLSAGCKSIGPGTVKRDRLHYTTAVTDSWKEQLLLNIVRTRYGDAPGFLEVSSVVSGYSLETGVSINGQFSPENLRGDTFAAAGVSGKYTDRPTISYSPMTGEKYARSLLAPVALEPLMFLVQGGVPADFIMGLTVHSFEGYRNAGIFGKAFHAADPEFSELLRLTHMLQQAGGIESEIHADAYCREIWLRFHPGRASVAGSTNALAEMKAALGVPPELDRVKVVFGTFHHEPGVIAIRTRSLMQILSTLGAGVDIHEGHLTDGAALPVDVSQVPPGFKGHSGKDKPEDPFVAVPYEGQWFWIERNDLGSKTTLAAVTMLFNFLEGGEKSSLVLTIPIN